MGRRIRITESDLRKIVEGTLNGLSWQTCGRAAQKAYDKYLHHLDDLTQSDYNYRKDIRNKDQYYNLNRGLADKFVEAHPKYPDPEYYDNGIHVAGTRSRIGVPDGNGGITYVVYDKNNPDLVTIIVTTPFGRREFSIERKSREYQRFVKENPWLKDYEEFALSTNESIVRSITESVMRRLRRGR